MRRVGTDMILVCTVNPKKASVRDEEAADDHSKDGGCRRRTEGLPVLVGLMQSCLIIYK